MRIKKLLDLTRTNTLGMIGNLSEIHKLPEVQYEDLSHKMNQNTTAELTRIHESDKLSKENMVRHEQTSTDLMADNVGSRDDRNKDVIEISNSPVERANLATDNRDAAAGNEDDNYNSHDEEDKEEEERQARLDKADKETCEERDKQNKEQEKNYRGKGGAWQGQW